MYCLVCCSRKSDKSRWLLKESIDEVCCKLCVLDYQRVMAEELRVDIG